MQAAIRKWLILFAVAAVMGGCASTGGNAYQAADPVIPARAARIAESMQGQPYQWGGMKPGGFDCSGLVHYAYSQAGASVPRTARQQYKAVRALYVHQLAPGDLVFFSMPGKLVSHVGIYLGDQRFVHALNQKNPVMISRLDKPYWQHRLVRAGSLVR